MDKNEYMEIEQVPKNVYRENRKLWIFIGCCVVVDLSYQLLVRTKINRSGVYIQATVVKSEGYKGGILTTLKYFFRDKGYEGRVHSGKKQSAGDRYFIRILPNDPHSVIFLENNPVPPCLLNIAVPYDGWDTIPNCK